MKTDRRWFRPWMLLALFLASFATASQARNYLLVGEYISTTGSILESPNGRAIAVVQQDGNICVYTGAPPTRQPYTNGWCSMHYQQFFKTDYYVTIQSDGNVCEFGGKSPAVKGRNAWCNMAYGPQGQYYLILDNHGNLCSHKGPNPQNDYGVLWCTMDMSNATAPQPGVIDVSATLAETFNSDPNAWKTLAQAAGASSPELWYVESMKITQLQNTSFNYTPPAGMLWPVASKEIVNCDATQVSETVTLTGDVTNSYSVSKSKTFDTSVSATVSYSGIFASGSVTATAGFSMTDSSSSSTSNSSTASDAQTIGFNERGGRIAMLQTLRQQGKAIPWQASFTPTDTQAVNVVVRRMGGNDRVNATLQWNQIKSYLPADKRALVLNGTLDVDQADTKGSRITTYRMADADVDAICAQAPVVMQSGYKSPAPGAMAASSFNGINVAGAAPAAATAVAPKRGTVQREVPQAQALAIMRSQQPVH